jgi:hypothetical protein
MSRKKLEVPEETVEITRMRERHSHVLTDVAEIGQVIGARKD